LRVRGLDVALARQATAGRAVLGICGGYQLLGTVIDDPFESGPGPTGGLGLLPLRTRFGPDKVLARPQLALANGTVVEGYEIHHGMVTTDAGEPLVADAPEPWPGRSGMASWKTTPSGAATSPRWPVPADDASWWHRPRRSPPSGRGN